MNNRIENIKEHVKKHKVKYACGATAVVSVGFTCLIMRGRYEVARGGTYGPETIDTSVTMRPLAFLSQQHNTVEVIARDGRGHPGYIVHCLDTDQFFSSQRMAALYHGISETILSKHLNGKLPDAEGIQFERLQIS